MKTVYLAGPVAGWTEKEANSWRQWMSRNLDEYNIRGISPLRCEPSPPEGEAYEVDMFEDPRFGTKNAVLAKNLFDVRNCDATLAYIPGVEGKRHSWGTMCELSIASELGKMTILVSDDPLVLEHPLLCELSGWRLTSLEDALDVLAGVMGAYT